jgi:hypothetical protein
MKISKKTQSKMILNDIYLCYPENKYSDELI